MCRIAVRRTVDRLAERRDRLLIVAELGLDHPLAEQGPGIVWIEVGGAVEVARGRVGVLGILVVGTVRVALRTGTAAPRATTARPTAAAARYRARLARPAAGSKIDGAATAPSMNITGAVSAG